MSGHSGALVVGRAGTVPIAVLQGRVHSYEGHSLEDVVFPVRTLGRLGVRTVVMTNAAGAINPDFAAGDLMVLTDHINLLGNPLLGPNEARLGPRFPDMTEAYDPELRRARGRGLRGGGGGGSRGRLHRGSRARPTRRRPRFAWPGRWARTPSECPRCRR